MPKKKNYPRWFSYYCKPHRPSKPIEPPKTFLKTTTGKNIASIEDDSYYIDIDTKDLLSKISENDQLRLTLSHEQACYGDDYCTYGATLDLYKTEEVEDPNYNTRMSMYKKALEKYKKDYAQWKEKSAEWKRLKKRWDDETKQEKEESERKLYMKLKKKYDVLQ